MSRRAHSEKKYDVFVSYRSLNRDWVRVLAENLVNVGFRVFLDIWELVPGHSFADGLWKGLRRSRKGILVATPEAVESGWVRAEYEEMLNLSREASGFTCIPLVLGDIPELPFLNNIQFVDFRVSSPDEYLHAFHSLVCGLKDEVPGSRDAIYSNISMPQPADLSGPGDESDLFSERLTEDILLDRIFDGSAVSPITVVLAQSYRKSHNLIEGIKERARLAYRKNSILHISLPYSEDVNSERYVRRLSEQCDFPENVVDWFGWEGALERMLRRGEKIFMLVSGFEHGSRDCRQSLAGVIRGLVQQYESRLRVVLLGGERLAELKYEYGALSLLNISRQLDWPENSLGDVLTWQAREFPELSLGKRIAEEILCLCGGHPWLIHYYLQFLRDNGSMEGASRELRQDSFLWQMFTPYRNSPGDANRICEWLEGDDLGPVEPWPADKLLRHLYWNNLLETSKGRYRWRCEIIRDVGRQALACPSAR